MGAKVLHPRCIGPCHWAGTSFRLLCCIGITNIMLFYSILFYFLFSSFYRDTTRDQKHMGSTRAGNTYSTGHPQLPERQLQVCCDGRGEAAECHSHLHLHPGNVGSLRFSC